MKNKNYPSWLVPLETAKELKKIGFDLECAFFYDDICEEIAFDEYDVSLINWNKKTFFKCISLPTLEQVFEWFREKGYIGTINLAYIDKNNFYYKFQINGKCNFINEEKFTNYEDAREKLVKTLIETYKTNEIL